jgi:hypothetical protein
MIVANRSRSEAPPPSFLNRDPQPAETRVLDLTDGLERGRELALALLGTRADAIQQFSQLR